jgi:hypothetical protein
MKNSLICKCIIGILLLSIFGCQKEEPILETITPISETKMRSAETSENYPNGGIVLGQKLENPYELEVMQQAYDNLITQNPSLRESAEKDKLKETHYYIKFNPESEKEYAILTADPALIFYEYPLDYEIKVKGNSYQDPEIPVGKPTYQYCAVEVKKTLPKGVKYKVLAKLFIPEAGDGQFAKLPNGRITASELSNQLEYEAFRLTKNLDDLKNRNSKNGKIAGYTPAGKITVWDDLKNQVIGMEGVEVRARRWFTTYTGITNAAGDYTCNGSFINDANYSIDWERYNFAIRDGWLSGACYDGPKQGGNWDLYLNGGAQMFYARIFRAAYRYYYKDINGLRRPPENSFWSTQLHIRAYDEENTSVNGSHCPSCRFLGLGSAIKIYNPSRPSSDVFGTVIHELAHAAHWNMNSNGYNNAETILSESWARGVQWSLGNLEYSNYSPVYFTNYTGVVQDMIDPLDGYDQVEGYTIRQLEDALYGQTTWNDWRNVIKNIYNNATENNLDNLFDFWD